jgi:hypothetical protein
VVEDNVLVGIVASSDVMGMLTRLLEAHEFGSNL